MDSGEMLTPEENAKRKKEGEKQRLEGIYEYAAQASTS
jgi:hypothetical protein